MYSFIKEITNTVEPLHDEICGPQQLVFTNLEGRNILALRDLKPNACHVTFFSSWFRLVINIRLTDSSDGLYDLASQNSPIHF